MTTIKQINFKNNIMKEIKISIDDTLIDTFGYSLIETKLQDFVSILLVKFSAMEILKDIENIDIANDPEWLKARDLAWEQEKNKYLKSITV